MAIFCEFLILFFCFLGLTYSCDKLSFLLFELKMLGIYLWTLWVNLLMFTLFLLLFIPFFKYFSGVFNESLLLLWNTFGKCSTFELIWFFRLVNPDKVVIEAKSQWLSYLFEVSLLERIIVAVKWYLKRQRMRNLQLRLKNDSCCCLFRGIICETRLRIGYKFVEFGAYERIKLTVSLRGFGTIKEGVHFAAMCVNI